jgi:hypothetical protein
MDIGLLEREIRSSIADTLESKGVGGPDIKIKAKTRSTSAKVPMKPQGIGDGDAIVEWPDARCTVVSMKISVRFVVPDTVT